MIPRESNKGYIAKTGRCVGTRVRNKTRIVIWPFRTHKPLLLKSPSERLVWSAFAKRQCGLLALTKVKRKLSTQDLTLKPQQGLGPEKWIHPVSEWLRGTKLVARLVDRKSFKMETTRWASKFYKFTLCRDFFAGIPQVIQSNHSVYNAQFARR